MTKTYDVTLTKEGSIADKRSVDQKGLSKLIEEFLNQLGEDPVHEHVKIAIGEDLS